MQINQLPSTSTVNSTDLLVKEQANGTTQKIAISDFVVNNLTSTSTNQPLSAAQGKALNDKITNKVSYETEFDVSVSSGCHFYCDRVGRTIFIDIVINFTSAVAINTQIAHIDGIAHILESHASAIGSNGTGARFLLQPSGILKIERALPANEWFSFSFVVLYNTEV